MIPLKEARSHIMQLIAMRMVESQVLYHKFLFNFIGTPRR